MIIVLNLAYLVILAVYLVRDLQIIVQYVMKITSLLIKVIL